MTDMKKAVNIDKRDDRLWSLDALRGLDMCFIAGLGTLIFGLSQVFGCSWLARQMHHVAWAGLAQHDTIFPLFLFLAGVSWPFSLASQRSRGRTTWQIHRKILLRMAILFLLGLSTGGLLAFKPDFRVPSVLGYIGLSWGLAALVFMHVRKPLARAGIALALLVGTWCVLRFLIAPGAPAEASSYSCEWNVISWLDRTLMPNHIYKKALRDPESLFSLANGVAMSLIGMGVGEILRLDSVTKAKKAGLVFLCSMTLFALDMCFIFILGDVVVKALWTSSFVLSTAAYSAAMLALFYWIIDVRGWRRWTFVFRVVGMNSIAVYMAGGIGIVSVVQKFLFEGLISSVGEPWVQTVQGATYLVTAWGLLYYLYRKRIFIRV